MTRRVKLGRGIGDIKFGMSSSNVVNILGQPDDTEQEKHDDGNSTQSLIYEELGLAFDFSSIDDFKLSSISLSADDISIGRLIRVGLSKQKVFEFADKLEWGDGELEDISPDNEAAVIEVIWFDQINVSIWFEDNEVYEIEFGPFWKDEESFVWP